MLFDDTALSPIPYLACRTAVIDAEGLIADFGDDAGYQAAARAEHSRALGNVVHFAHWRQIERLVVLLASEAVVGTVH